MPKKDGTPTLRERMQEGLEKRGFVYNGCSSSPDFDFGSCCNRHDFDYQDLTKSRKQADNDLFKCMTRKSWKGKLLAPLYWLAVRVAGGSHYQRKQNAAAIQAISPTSPDLGTSPGLERL